MNLANLTTLLMASTVVLSTIVPSSSYADDKTKKLLLGIGAVATVGAILKGQKKSTSGSTSTSKSSSATTAAKNLQRDLNQLGFDAGPVDGLPGAQTRRAVKAYQVSRSFEPTGELTSEQRVALGTDAKETSSPVENSAGLSKIHLYETQVYLNYLGYPVGNADGIWGSKSQNALQTFRNAFGLDRQSEPSNDDLNSLYFSVHNASPIGRSSTKDLAENTLLPSSIGNKIPNDVQVTRTVGSGKCSTIQQPFLTEVGGIIRKTLTVCHGDRGWEVKS